MGLLNFIFSGQKADKARRGTLAAQGFSPCTERHVEIERRFNGLSSSTGQGGYTIRDPYCAEVAGHPVFFFTSAPPPTMAIGSSVARPVTTFMLPFTGAKGRAQVWLTNSAIEANTMVARKIRLALSALDYETPGSTLVTLAIPTAWKTRNVIGALVEPGLTLDALVGETTAGILLDAGEHGFFRALFGDRWMALENFPYAQAFSAPQGSLNEQCAFAKKLIGR